MSVRSKNHYLGYTFGGLWLVGLFCFIFLVGSFARNFKVRMPVEDKISVTTPVAGKLYVDVNRSNLEYYHGDWFGFRFNDEMPVYGVNMDTLMLNTIRVKLAKSKDSGYHVTRIRLSQGNTREVATRNADNIHFNIDQQDSLLYLPEGFAVSSTDKFRNQQVLVIIEVPVGKKIQMNEALNHYSWFNINVNNRRGWNVNFDDYNDESYSWEANKEYIMTPDGLKNINELDPAELKNGRFKIIIDEDGEKVHVEGDVDNKKNKSRYRYKQNKEPDSLQEKKKRELELQNYKYHPEKKTTDSVNKTVKNNTGKDSKESAEPVTSADIVSPMMIYNGLVN